MTEQVKVLIEVQNGCLISVLSDTALDVRVVDYDSLEDGDPAFGRMFADDTPLLEFMATATGQY